MSSELKIGQYLEWCTDLPSIGGTGESPVFFLMGNEWIFQLVIEYGFGANWYLNIYLDLKNKHTDLEPCQVKCQIVFKKKETLSLHQIVLELSHHCQILSILLEEFHKKLPSYYIGGNSIKLILFFGDVTGPLLKLGKKTEDRSIQTASYLNADISKESLFKDFSELLDTGINHDVEIKCKEHSIKAHKTVLCARSDVFSAMLLSDMQEGQTGVVEIQDMDGGYFQDFVRYLYSDTMPELTFDKAKVLYEAGDKYNIKSLMLRCSEYFQDFLTPENIFECFTLADAHSDLKLKNKIITYILEEKVFLQKEYWLPFYENYPKVALEVYKLSYEKN